MIKVYTLPVPIDYDLENDPFCDRVINAIYEAENLGLIQAVVCEDGIRRYVFDQNALDYVVTLLAEDKALPN